MTLETMQQRAPERATRERQVAAPLRTAYTIAAVAQSEGVSIPTIRRWVREGKFPRPTKRGGVRGRCVWYGETLDALRAS